MLALRRRHCSAREGTLRAFAADSHGRCAGGSQRCPRGSASLGHDRVELERYVKASTEITHSDPKAYYASLAIAVAAYQSAFVETLRPEHFRAEIESMLSEQDARELLDLIERATRSAAANETVAEFAARIGSRNGISGYCYHTVPCVLQVWFRYGEDFTHGLEEIIKAGGDTDTAGAIFGGIVGARIGKRGIPRVWLANIVEWPRTVAWMEHLGRAVARGTVGIETQKEYPGYFVPGVPLRNLVFLVIVLAHGLRRLGPPY
jgi:ADP-ribosyl-[dinitrogen reductase] hydrolase